MHAPVMNAPATKTTASKITPVRLSANGQPSASPAWERALGNAPLAALKLPVQTKLTVNEPGDAFEEQADQVAETVMRMPEPRLQRAPCACGGEAGPDGECAACQQKRLGVQRQASGRASLPHAPASVHKAIHSLGQPLDTTIQHFMGSRFGHNFGSVRIHTSDEAAASARDVGAHAYTVGTNVVFGRGKYAPQTSEGKRLLAHELAHVVQQDAMPTHVQRDHYTQAEREAMTQGRVVGQQNDINMANQRGFQPGDIVFRMGSTGLGFLTGEPVTHGGIYTGSGLIHDVVGFGNRHVRVTNFFNPALGEAADANRYRLVRFRGPLRDLIVARLLHNISRRDFNMPTDRIPFNLFSSADDYRTANCLEYAHAQFLHAIRQLAADPSVSPADRALLRSTYFASGATEPTALIRPQEQRLVGNMATASTSPTLYGGGPSRGPSALTQQAALVGAATALATDVDPTRFSNRAESQYTEHWPGGSGFWGTIGNLLMGPSYDEVVLRTFTYRSFVDSRQFFEDVTGR